MESQIIEKSLGASKPKEIKLNSQSQLRVPMHNERLSKKQHKRACNEECIHDCCLTPSDQSFSYIKLCCLEMMMSVLY